MKLPENLINTISEKGVVFIERLLNVFVKKVEESADDDEQATRIAELEAENAGLKMQLDALTPPQGESQEVES